ncbi:MAG: molecular chaperone TorD family protein [Isosphaeraceae bacterium]
MQAVELETKSEVDLAREFLYRFLSLALTSPHSPDWPFPLSPDDQRLALESAVVLQDEADFPSDFLSFGELSPDNLDLVALLNELNSSLDQIKADHNRIFGLVIPKECPPYETEYVSTSEAFQRTQQLADIAGFYCAFGLEPSNQSPERHDNVVLELEFMAFLLLKKRLAVSDPEDVDEAAEHVLVCEEAEHSFMKDHLSWWLPAFATGLMSKSGSGVYHEIGRTLAALIPAERYRLNVAAPFKPARPELIEYPEEDGGCETGSSSGETGCSSCGASGQ